MDVSNLPGLPALIAANIIGTGEAAFGLLLLLQAPIAAIPGFRPQDGTRNALMRVLLFALTLGGTVGLAWTQNVVIARPEWPVLLATCAAAAGLGHFTYVGKQKLSGKTSNASAPSVPPLPPDALPVPAVAQS